MGRYADRLQRRLRHPAPAGRPLTNFRLTFGDPIEPAPVQEFEIVVPPHPHKYPDHEGSKGSVLGGICNTTRCDRAGADRFNIGTRGYYCGICAEGIDYNPRKPPICIPVDHDLTHEEMDALYDKKVW